MDTPALVTTPEDDGPQFRRQNVGELLAEANRLVALGCPEAAVHRLRIAFSLCLRAKACVENRLNLSASRKWRRFPDTHDLLSELKVAGKIGAVEGNRLGRLLEVMRNVSRGEGAAVKFLPEIIAAIEAMRSSLAC
jgi:hypothetical protein